MKACAAWIRAVHDLADGAPVSREARGHVERCAACSAVLCELTELDRLLLESPCDVPPVTLRLVRDMPVSHAAAAVAVAVLLLAWLPELPPVPSIGLGTEAHLWLAGLLEQLAASMSSDTLMELSSLFGSFVLITGALACLGPARRFLRVPGRRSFDA